MLVGFDLTDEVGDGVAEGVAAGVDVAADGAGADEPDADSFASVEVEHSDTELVDAGVLAVEEFARKDVGGVGYVAHPEWEAVLGVVCRFHFTTFFNDKSLALRGEIDTQHLCRNVAPSFPARVPVQGKYLFFW